jgi:hypothetical protein
MTLELKDVEHLINIADLITASPRKLTDDEKTTWIENKNLSTDKVIVYNKFNDIRYLLIYCPLYSVVQVRQIIDELLDYPITDEQIDSLNSYSGYQFKLVTSHKEYEFTNNSEEYEKDYARSTPTLKVYIHRDKKFGKIVMVNHSSDQANRIFNRFLERKQLKVCKPIYEIMENLKKNE